MIDLFKIIIVTSIWILGLTICTQKKMVLYFIRDYLTDENGNARRKIYEPLIVCHWCMPSIHSVFGISFSIILGFVSPSWNLAIMYPLIVMGSSITVGLVWQIYLVLDKTYEHLTQTEQLAYFEVKKQKQNYQKQNKNNGNGNTKIELKKKFQHNENY
jgi:hypothetical protein